MKISFYSKLVLFTAIVIAVSGYFGARELDAEQQNLPNNFYDEIQHIESISKLKHYLDIEDPQNVRLVINKLVELDAVAAVPILRKLWADDQSGIKKHVDTYRHPIVRLTIAEKLLDLSPATEYAEYIKQTSRHENWIVNSIAAEALAIVNDLEAIELLLKLARSENPFVAESALDSLSRISKNGTHAMEANQAITVLHKDSKLRQEKIRNKIEEVYKNIELQRFTSTEIPIDQDRNLDQLIQPYLEKNEYQAAIDILLPSAKKGNVHALHIIGELYIAMSPPDYGLAYKWLLKAVNMEYAPAKTSLANLFLSGRGVEKNESKAISLLKEAENQGDRTARIMLEKAHNNGWWGL